MFRNTIRPALIALVCCVCLSVSAASAQSDEQPPFEDDLLRLAEIIGALEYLHPLCARQKAGVWKVEMANLLDSVGADPARRARHIAHYNQAYARFTQLHRSCTEVTTKIVDIYEKEAIVLTRQMANEFRPLVQQEVLEPVQAEDNVDANSAN